MCLKFTHFVHVQCTVEAKGIAITVQATGIAIFYCSLHCRPQESQSLYSVNLCTLDWLSVIFLISSYFQGDLVYVNYGRPSDFKILIDKGVNCSGKIVIVRYGRVFRGDKVF